MGKLSLFCSFPGVFWNSSISCCFLCADCSRPTKLAGHQSGGKSMEQCVMALYRVGFHSPQIQTALFLHTVKSSFPCVDTLLWFEKCIFCKVFSHCERPLALSLDVFPLCSFLPLLLLHPPHLPPFLLYSFTIPSLTCFLPFSLSVPGVSVINRLKRRLLCKYCVIFSFSKISTCFRSWECTLSSLSVLGDSGEHCCC